MAEDFSSYYVHDHGVSTVFEELPHEEIRRSLEIHTRIFISSSKLYSNSNRLPRLVSEVKTVTSIWLRRFQK